MFYPEDIGKEFTRIEIHNRVGGSQQSYLPDLGGRIVAACLKLEHNSDAPNVIICGNGPKIAKTGEFLANQQGILCFHSLLYWLYVLTYP